MAAQGRSKVAPGDERATGDEAEVHDLTDEEMHALLDRQAHEALGMRALGMSRDEFVRAWGAGEFGTEWDDKPAVRWLVVLLSLGR